MKGLRTMAVISCLSGFCCAAAAQDKAAVVVMLGDSTTVCSASEPGKKLTDLVQASLTADFKLNVNVVNAGVGSDTIKGVTLRSGQDM